MAKFLRSKWIWAIATAVAVVGLYALLGFKVAPNIARDQAQAFVREHYQRELAIGAIAIHPFKLQVEVRDLALPDADGQPMLGFERLFVDFEVSSLWNRAYTFKDVIVVAPLLRAVVRPDGSLNLADLALPDEEPDKPIPSLWLQALTVERGAVRFRDGARPEPFEQDFEDVGFSLRDFRTTPEGGDFSFAARGTEGGEFAWQGRFALEPTIASAGSFRITDLHPPGVGKFLGQAMPARLTKGSISLAGTYATKLDDTVELEVTVPQVEVTDLGVRAMTADADWVGIPSLVVSDTHLSLAQQSVRVAKVAVTGLAVEAWRSIDGKVNLEQLFAMPAAATATTATTAAAPINEASAPDGASASATAAATEKPWTVTVGQIELTGAKIAFEDRSLTPATRFDLAPLNARVSDVSLDLSRPLPVRLDAVINGQARFDASGTLTPEPLAVDVDVKLAKARMQILQPYVLPVADLTITGGELNVEGKATLAPPDNDGPGLAFRGNVTIDGFRSVDNALKQDLVSFKQLELVKLGFAMSPDSLTIDRVLVRQPYARVIISPERVVNIAAVLDPRGTAEALAQRRAENAAEAARTPAERRRLAKERAATEKVAAKARKDGTTPSPAVRPVPADTFPIRVREIRIDGGRMSFSDSFVKPHFAAEVQQLSGTVVGVSSAYESRAKVNLAGKLDEFSPVSIQGELQPFAFDRYTDLGLKFENIALPIINPYSTPFAGYNIAKGKLTTDLHYTVIERKLDAQHRVRIDQLEWGEATATKGEATLPVKFATSLLKDKDGVIVLDVPVGGTLDDPSFRIGPIVWQIIKNIIVKVVSAPFSLLGSLFAGAEEAQFIDFTPGEATLDAATAERLGALAKSLGEKPQLKLDVPIGALAELDLPALNERAYRAAVDGAVAASFGRKVKPGEPVPTYGSLEADRKVDVLTELLKQQTGAAPQVPEAPQPPEGTPRAEAKALRQAAAIEYLERTARSGVTVPDAELAQLAEARAAAIERALLTGGALDPTRVFKVREGKVSVNEGKVRFQLGLQ
jgi:uncharacterized protein involved in outer membrane biogenesis